MTGAVDFCGLALAHPIVNASGTFDAIAASRAFGREALHERFPFSAFVSKTITLRAREGNPPPRLWELGEGMINSIGLPNRGLAGYLEEDLPELALLPAPLIVNVMGFAPDEFAVLVETVAAQEAVAAIELNVSCPNVESGLVVGADRHECAALLRRLRPLTSKPLIVKLTPNAADVPAIAAAAEAAGADAVSLVNTLRGMALAPLRNGRGAAPTATTAAAQPWLGGGSGGVSGPAIQAIALVQVHDVARRVGIPVVGMGGVRDGRDARALLDAGATLVAVGTESFRDPLAAARVRDELAQSESAAKAHAV